MINHGTDATDPQPYSHRAMAGRPPSSEGTEFGKRVAEARKRKGLTQAELAAALGVTGAMIVYCERRAANPSLDLLVKLSKALDVTVAELVGEKTQKKGKPGPQSELEERFDRLRQLPRRDQETVLKMLDGLLAANS